jgi:DNA topoisomerase I
MTKLVIVESPAKCQKIQGYLGPGWRVIATMGHIRALEESLDAIGFDRDFEPKYTFIKEKAKTIKQLKEAAGEVSEIYLAADGDREGESIAYAVCLLLKLNPETTKRAVFHEITEKAIKNAINNPTQLDMNCVNAQKARAILDMMIGFTVSPLLWRYVAPSLSAGRCQTPALRLVVERENQIANFKASSSWQLKSSCKTSNSSEVKSFKFSTQLGDELEDEESALNYMENVNSIDSFTVISKDIKPWQEKSPEPLITSTLQQQASAMYHINPKNAMKIAQKLYEAGHITYMRTDKAVLSEDARNAAKEWVLSKYGNEYLANDENTAKELKDRNRELKDAIGSVKKTKKKAKTTENGSSQEVKAQEAHEAIRPTYIEHNELPAGATWTAYDRKIYNLIWQRTIQSVMSSARGETCKVKMILGEDDDFNWWSSWKRTTFEGWKRVGRVVEIDDMSDDDNKSSATNSETEWYQALSINIGDRIPWEEMRAEPKESRAQSRYTEATLVRELERHGIGRPSTFASLLSVIQDKNYVSLQDIPPKEIETTEYSVKPNRFPPEKKTGKKKLGGEKSKLVPTDLGRSVLTFVLKHFDDLFNYGFTATMERRLDAIAEGNEVWKQVLRDMWASYKDRYEELLAKQSAKPKKGEPNTKVREFSGGLKAVQTKKGPLLLIEADKKEDTQFLGWPTGIAFESITEEVAEKFKVVIMAKKAAEEAALGEWNGTPIVKKTGKFGEYLKCGEVSIPYISQETHDKTLERLEAKASGTSNNTLAQFKEYSIKTGQYGPYIMKTSLKKPQFVSLPKDVEPKKLTEHEVDALYKAGLETKKKWKGGTSKYKKFNKE